MIARVFHSGSGAFTAVTFFLLLALCSYGPPAYASGDKTTVQNAWVQVVPPGLSVLRAITSDRECPTAYLDGRSKLMSVRAEANTDFNVLTCELGIPDGTRDIVIAGRRLKPLSSNPKRIAIVGDTGCRMKDGDALDDGFQNCGDPDDWEFAKVARRVAQWQPDLIIQLGDYIYREQACPAGCNNCKGSPYNSPGMRMDTWDVEFFEPGRVMLEAAPVVFVRGDHEKCERAGGGYFRFLDAGDYQACVDFSAPYAINFEQLQLVVMDTVQADDTSLSPDVVIERYSRDFEKAANLATGNSWLISHRPIWALRPAAKKVAQKDNCLNQPTPKTLITQNINITAQQALRASALNGSLPPTVELVLTSHIHVGEVLSFTGMRPPQVVVGISGTKLLPAVEAPLVNTELDGELITHATLLSKHGFFGFKPARKNNNWRATVIDVQGETMAKCRIGDKSARCSTR